MENNSDIEKAAEEYADKVMSLVENTVITKATFLDLKDINKQAYTAGRLDEKAVLPDLKKENADLRKELEILQKEAHQLSIENSLLNIENDSFEKENEILRLEKEILNTKLSHISIFDIPDENDNLQIAELETKLKELKGE